MSIPGMPPVAPPAAPQAAPGAGLTLPNLGGLGLPQAAPKVPPTPAVGPKRKKPDPGVILTLLDDAKQAWQVRDQRMDQDIAYINLQNGETDVAGNAILSNIPRVMVDKSGQLAAASEWSVSVVPPRTTDRAIAQKVKDYCLHAWDEWDRAWQLSGNNSLDHDLAWYTAGRGWVAIRIQLDPLAGPEQVPAHFIPYDSRQIYPVWNTTGGLNYVAHIYRQTVAQVIADWPDVEKQLIGADGSGRKLTDLVTVKAFYDDWWYAVFVEDVLVEKPTDHQYGFVPWIITVNEGSPIQATDQDQTNWVNEKGPTVFHTIKTAYDFRNKLMSMMADEVERASNPPMIHKVDAGNKDDRDDLILDPGVVNYILSNEEVTPMYVGPQPPQSGPLMQLLNEDIEKGGLPSALWSLASDSNTSGFAQSIAASGARDALGGIFRALTFIKQEAFRMLLTLIRDHYQEDVGYFVKDQSGNWTSGETLTIEEIGQVGVIVKVKYKDMAPKDKLAWANMAIQLTDKKLISLETAREEFLDIENPGREDERVLSELIYMNQQVVESALIPQALSQTDPQKLMLYLQARQAPPPGGPPGAPPQQAGAPPPGQVPNIPQPNPGTLPPQMAGAAGGGPLDLLLHASQSAAGGAGAQQAPGVPGAGALPIRLPPH